MRRRLRREMPDPRLRGAEVELLRLVVTRPGIGVSDAAKDLGLAANSVSTLVNQLVGAGYLVRETDPADRRAARLLPTPAAGTRLREWRRRRADLVRRHVSRLDEADRQALHAAIPACASWPAPCTRRPRIHDPGHRPTTGRRRRLRRARPRLRRDPGRGRALLGVALTWNPLKLLAVAAIVVLGSAFFSCLSMTIAGIVLSRDRLMGIGQAITMPLFFGSSALYPVSVMPGWLQAVSKATPLSYEVDALRGLLLGTPHHLASDFAVLLVAAALGVTAASALLGRLAR
ncbi:ABC transporter permease [Streptomyces coeruleorubidus]|uniref:ABC transporter permease n=1 Tax=Streptomyces coeruleorubidus TaxID=116188 RepID=UPI00198BD0AA|nr:ABC transporter permease [Streptomyces coeruleorubidus]GGT82584.1 hypothetical protein GCM10010256_47960 [Streptomyces coeruleorubidus]